MATSPSPSPQNWFHPQPVLPTSQEVGQAHLVAQDAVAEQQVIERVCAQVAPSWARVCTAPLTMGRTAIWIEPAGEAAAQPMSPEQYRRQAGIAYNQMAHELSLIGWRTDADDRVLLVLGWSTEQLWGRASLLQLALTHDLADVEPTVAHAIQITTMVVAEQAKPNRQLAISDVAVETSRRIAAQLRWPSRLAVLAGLERVSALRAQQYAFTQIAGLEAKVAARCEEHLAVARLVAYHLCERLQQGISSRQACRDVLAWAVSRLHAGTSEAEQGKSEMGVALPE